MVATLCASIAAQEHGDARRAIDLLRVAGEIADSLGRCQVEEEDVRTALEKIEIDRVIEVVKKLPTQSKASLLACLYVFESNQECDTNNIYNVYSAICKEVLIDALTQRRMTDLLAELDQLGIIEGTIVFKGRYGRKKQITRIASKDHMLETLYQDFNLKNIKDVPRSTFLKTLTRRW
jgi:cell division control protein 6